MPKYETYYTDGGEEVQAYKVETPHEVSTIGGVRQASEGEYVVARDRHELVDVYAGPVFEADHSTNKPADVDDVDDEDEDEDEDEGYDPTQHTVAEVQTYLRENPDQRDYVLARESAGSNRTQLRS